MKRIYFLLTLLCISAMLMAQDCDNLQVNLKKGTINGIKPTASQATIKKKLPCFTGDSEEGGPFNCGGGVFFLNHDFFCYTGADYIEFRKNFSGTLSVPVLGMDEATAIQQLGMGEPVRRQANGGSDYVFLKTRYGCLVLKFIEGIVKQVGMYAKPEKDVVLCL